MRCGWTSALYKCYLVLSEATRNFSRDCSMFLQGSLWRISGGGSVVYVECETQDLVCLLEENMLRRVL